MPQNTMGSYTGRQVQPVFKTGAAQQPGQTPLTPQSGLGTNLPPPVPVTQQPMRAPSFNSGGQPLWPGGDPSYFPSYTGAQAQPQFAQTPTVNNPAETTTPTQPAAPTTPRERLVGAVMNQAQGRNRNPQTYDTANPNAMVPGYYGRMRQNSFFKGYIEPSAPNKSYVQPGLRGILRQDDYPDLYPDWRYSPGSIWDRR